MGAGRARSLHLGGACRARSLSLGGAGRARSLGGAGSVGSRTGAGSVKMSISAESSVGQFVLSRLGKGMRRGLIEEICFY